MGGLGSLSGPPWAILGRSDLGPSLADLGPSGAELGDAILGQLGVEVVGEFEIETRDQAHCTPRPTARPRIGAQGWPVMRRMRLSIRPPLWGKGRARCIMDG